MLLERQEGRERNIDWPPPAHTQTRDQTCNLGMCPDWELNLQPFSYGMMLQPNEPHGHGWLLFYTGVEDSLTLGRNVEKVKVQVSRQREQPVQRPWGGTAVAGTEGSGEFRETQGPGHAGPDSHQGLWNLSEGR